MSRFSNDGDDTPPTRLVRNAAADQPTRHVEPQASPSTEEPAVTRRVSFEPAGTMGSGTASGQAPAVPVQTNPDGAQTVLFRPSGASSIESASSPTVGWLVVVSGPGKGTSLNISYGLQKIGRDPGQHIALSFGDEKISRQHHAALEYDPKLRKFFLSKGENLVYLNGERVGAGSECELKAGDQLEMGETILRFIPFCGPDFDWHSA